MLLTEIIEWREEDIGRAGKCDFLEIFAVSSRGVPVPALVPASSLPRWRMKDSGWSGVSPP